MRYRNKQYIGLRTSTPLSDLIGGPKDDERGTSTNALRQAQDTTQYIAVTLTLVAKEQ